MPFYKNEQLVAACLAPLTRMAAELRAARAELVVFNDSPDHAPLQGALETVLPWVSPHLPVRYRRNETNLGFVRTMNLAIAEAVAKGRDLLLLNSDVELEPGAIAQMRAIMAGDPSIGFVNPRSNNATLTTLPIGEAFADAPRAEKWAAFQALARLLPRLSYAPTAVGYCLLIRWEVIAELGGFDEIYGAGYNEENDLVMRASRLGWRVALANHGFAWHEGSSSFATASVTRDTWELRNRAILDARYPEYDRYTRTHWDWPETMAERILAALLPQPDGRRDFAFDFSSFRPDHNGTFVVGRQLLEVAGKYKDRYNLFVMCSEEVYRFHGYEALGITRADPHEGRIYAGVFRVGQPYDWGVLQRLTMRAAAIGVYMLDTISIDCPQLTSPRLYNMWEFTLRHCDVLAGQSRQTIAMFERRFAIPARVRRLVSYHPLDLAVYRLKLPARPKPQDGSLLVVGNHFHHKYLSATANALAAALPGREVVALGQAKAPAGAQPDPNATVPLADLPNLTGLAVGLLSDETIGELYAAAAVVVFPSHAEGFGFPALNALAMHKPVFLRRLPVFLELWEKLGRTPNFHFYDTTAELIERLRAPPGFVPDAEPALPHEGAARSLDEIMAAMEIAMRDAAFDTIVARLRHMQFVSDDICRPPPPAPPPPSAPPAAASLGYGERAARRAGQYAEYVARGVFASPITYHAGRAGVLALRAVLRPFRRH